MDAPLLGPRTTLLGCLATILIALLIFVLYLLASAGGRPEFFTPRIRAQISNMEKGVEMFKNDFGHYPDSSYGQDPIDWSRTWYVAAPMTQPPNGAYLTGAHWLTRAMIGHDYLGVDTKAVMLQCGFTPGAVSLSDFESPDSSHAANPGVFGERGGTYVDPQLIARDDDASRFHNQTNGPKTGRILIFDEVYNSPILYYRANLNGKTAASRTDGAGIYNHQDNAAITGGSGSPGWDFAATNRNTPVHNLGVFEGAPGSFADMVQNPDPQHPHQLKAVNPETFILISAGKDGIYGTPDDLTNLPPP